MNFIYILIARAMLHCFCFLRKEDMAYVLWESPEHYCELVEIIKRMYPEGAKRDKMLAKIDAIMAKGASL